MINLPFLLDEDEISSWAYSYCKYVKDDPKIREFITNPSWLNEYVFNINNDPKIIKIKRRK